jgi:hypothetical protein
LVPLLFQSGLEVRISRYTIRQLESQLRKFLILGFTRTTFLGSTSSVQSGRNIFLRNRSSRNSFLLYSEKRSLLTPWGHIYSVIFFFLTLLSREVREILGEFKKSLISDLKVIPDRLDALESRSGAPVEPSSPNQCQEEEDDTLSMAPGSQRLPGKVDQG